MATFKIEGMEEAIKMIKDVGELPQKCVTKAAKKGIQIAKKDAKGGGWVDETGYLRKSIKEKAEKSATLPALLPLYSAPKECAVSAKTIMRPNAFCISFLGLNICFFLFTISKITS